MMDVANKRCAFGEGCTKYPKFMQTDGCFLQHADESMVNVNSKRCAYRQRCTRQPTFNHDGSEAGACCTLHADESMLDVVHKRCAHSEGCTSRPSWGYWTDGKSTVCDTHKDDLSEGRVAINFNQRCKAAGYKGCGRTVKWGMDGKQPTLCHHHGLAREGEGLVRIPSGRRASRSSKPASGVASGRSHATGGAGSGSRAGGGVESADTPETHHPVETVPDDGHSDEDWDCAFAEIGGEDDADEHAEANSALEPKGEIAISL